MPGRGRVVRGLLTVVTTIGVVAAFVGWCAGANYLAFVTAGPSLDCRLFPADLVEAGWVFASLLVFLLLGAGLTALVGQAADRGRRARWIGIGVCVSVVVLSTWGYVMATHAVIGSLTARECVLGQ